MKYKVRDIIVLKDLETGRRYEGILFSEPMKDMRNRALRITGIDRSIDCYIIEGFDFSICDSMISFDTTATIQKYLKSGEYVYNKRTGKLDQVDLSKPKTKAFEKVVLPKKLKDELYASIAQIECNDKIYNIWGFSEIDGHPRTVLNFHGPSGTGKTMTAKLLAEHFNTDIVVASPSTINESLVGESEKIVKNLFKKAKENKAVLFFDEADSLVCKRSSRDAGASRHGNNVLTTILTELEEHEGIVIFATNLIESYDTAMESRILKHLYFPNPEKDARSQIIDKMIPLQVPLEDGIRSKEFLNQLADICEGFNGRVIKNTVLSLLTRAAMNGMEKITKELTIEEFTNAKESFKDLQNAKKTDDNKGVRGQ